MQSYHVVRHRSNSESAFFRRAAWDAAALLRSYAFYNCRSYANCVHALRRSYRTRERCAAAPVQQYRAGVVARTVNTSTTNSELSADVAKGFVCVAPEVPRISPTELAKFLKQVQLWLDVPILVACLQLDQSLQRAVTVSELAWSCGQLRTRSLREVVIAES